MVGLDQLATDLSRLGQELCPVAKALAESGHRYSVIGATAILLHGYNIIRATRDVDLVIAIEGGFPAAKNLLVGVGLQPTSISHRFETTYGMQVDALPIADADTEQQLITTPEGGSLSALGLSEAIRFSVAYEIGACSVSVATVPILIALKLTAAVERNRSDLADCCVCLSEYEREEARRYVAHSDHESALTYDTSGAYLAGADLLRNGGAQLVGATHEALTQLMSAEIPLIRAARSLGTNEGVPLALLQAFSLGMEP